jgi:hypothetical protein
MTSAIHKMEVLGREGMETIRVQGSGNPDGFSSRSAVGAPVTPAPPLGSPRRGGFIAEALENSPKERMELTGSKRKI